MDFQPGEINIICTDARSSLRFYRDVLGFEFVCEDGAACRLRAGDTSFLLLPFAAARRQAVEYCSTAEYALDLQVEDLREASAHLQRQGVKFLKPWQPGAPGFIIADPDGLAIEVTQKRRTLRIG